MFSNVAVVQVNYLKFSHNVLVHLFFRDGFSGVLECWLREMLVVRSDCRLHNWDVAQAEWISDQGKIRATGCSSRVCANVMI